ncbi:MAG: DUF2905 domain-containing protein [Cyclonatronaceae bacterium]
MSPEIGRLLIGLGVLIIVLGLVFLFFGDKLGWLGNLPGDLRFERGNTRVYLPFASMILLSILLTIIINIFRKLF